MIQQMATPIIWNDAIARIKELNMASFSSIMPSTARTIDLIKQIRQVSIAGKCIAYPVGPRRASPVPKTVANVVLSTQCKAAPREIAAENQKSVLHTSEQSKDVASSDVMDDIVKPATSAATVPKLENTVV